MKIPDARRWAGISAFAVALFLLIEALTKLTTGPRPNLDRSAALTAYLEATRLRTFAVILADTFLMSFLIVFLGCFRQISTRTRPDRQ